MPEPVVINDRYEIVRTLARGASGEVFAARDRFAALAHVALKRLHAAGASDAEASFRREFATLRHLAHANLARVHDLARDRATGRLFIIGELVEGSDLASWVAGKSQSDIVSVLLQALRVLDFIHARGFLHCDLKPENVYVAEGPTVKLLDFGLAARRDADPAREGWTPRGTLPYVAPEILAGARPDARSDHFSLGMLFFRAIQERFPFPLDPVGLPDRLDELPRLLALPENHLPEPFHAVIARLLEPRPASRFPRASEAAQWLARLVGREEAALEGPDVLVGSLIGRKAERLRLEAVAEALASGSAAPACLLIEGPAGVGKNRLVEELRTACNLLAVSFHAADAGAPADRPLDAVASIVEQVAASLGAEHPVVRSHAATLDRLRPDGAGSRAGVGIGAEQQGIREALTRFVIEACEQGPRVLYVRNLSRADADTAALISHLAVASRQATRRGTRPSRLLVVATRDSALHGPPNLGTILATLRDVAEAESMPVVPLSAGESEDLFLVLFGGSESVRPESRFRGLAARVHVETGGLPLYIEETARLLLAQGQCRWREGRFELPEGIEKSWRPPRDLDEALLGRLEELSPSERETLEALAILDHSASTRLVAEVTGRNDAGPALIGLVRRGLAETSTEDPPRHRVVRRRVVELILGRIPPDRARPLHARAHRALAAEGSGPALELRRARHLLLAGDARAAAGSGLAAASALEPSGGLSLARDFLETLLVELPAGEQASLSRTRELLAILHERAGEYDSALALYEKLGASEADPERLAGWLRQQAGIQQRLGRNDRARSLLKEAERKTADRPGSSAALEVATSLGFLLFVEGKYAEAAQIAESRLDRLEGADLSPEHGRLYNLSGSARLRTGDMEGAVAAYTRAAEILHRFGKKIMAASVHGNLGIALQRLGRSEEAAAHLRLSLDILKQEGHLVEASATLNNLGTFLVRRGDVAGAEEAFRESLEIRERMGEAYGIASALGNLAFAERERGDWVSALARLRLSLQRFRELKASREIAMIEGALGDCLQHLGRFDEAGEWIERSLADARAAAVPEEEGRTLLLRGRLRRVRGDLAPAEEDLREALRRFRGVNDPHLSCQALVELGLSARERGDQAEAQRSREDLHSIAESISHDGFRTEAALLEAAESRASGRTQDAIRALARALRTAARSQGVGLMARVHAAIAEASARVGRGARAHRHADLATNRLRNLALGLAPREREAFDRHPIWSEVRASIDRAVTSSSSAAGESQEVEEFRALLEVNKRLNSEMDMGKLHEGIIEHAVEATRAARGFLIVVENGQLDFTVARNIAKEEVRKPEFAISHSIVERVCREGSPIVARNAMADERFKQFMSVSSLRLSSVVCVPFRVKDQILGAIYLDNPDAEGVFTSRAIETLEAFSDQAAIAIWNLRQKKEIEALNAQLQATLDRRSQELVEVRRELARASADQSRGFEGMIGRSPAMRRVFELIERVAPSDLPVLITGENGTGKELVARAIVHRSHRSDRAFISQSCTAISESLLESELFGHVRGAFTGANQDRPGLFELADGGTLFLDEIGDMGVEMQKKLLRVLQEGELRRVGAKTIQKVDVRLVSATNKDLPAAIRAGSFREDLYYRINHVEIRLPALRERMEDLPALIEYFLVLHERAKGKRKTLSAEARQRLMDHPWPGNVRELRSEIERACTLADDAIGPEHLSGAVRGGGTAATSAARDARSLREIEREAIVQALDTCGGNKVATARRLGISRGALYLKLKEYGLRELRPGRGSK